MRSFHSPQTSRFFLITLLFVLNGRRTVSATYLPDIGNFDQLFHGTCNSLSHIRDLESWPRRGIGVGNATAQFREQCTSKQKPVSARSGLCRNIAREYLSEVMVQLQE